MKLKCCPLILRQLVLVGSYFTTLRIRSCWIRVARAAAAYSLSLSDVAAKAKYVSEVIGTMGVVWSVCTLPGSVTSDHLGPGKMELGVRIYDGGPKLGKDDYCSDCLFEVAHTMASADNYRDQRMLMKDIAEAALASKFEDGKCLCY